VWITVSILVLSQLAVTYLPPLQALFGTTAVPLRDGLLVIGIGVALFCIIEVEKQIRLRFSGAGRGHAPALAARGADDRS
jgi:hypothetical protein